MKKLFFISACAAILAGFSSCSDIDDPDFTLRGVWAHVLQQGDNTFRPVIFFATSYGAIDEDASSIVNDGVKLTGKSYSENTYETVSTYLSIDQINGNYKIEAISTSGAKSETSITIKFDKVMGELHFEDFEYSDGKLNVTVTEPVENAESYGFYKINMIDGQIVQSWVGNDLIGDVKASADNDQKVAVSFSSNDIVAGSIMIYPVALIKNNDNTYLARIDMSGGRVLEKGASSFSN